MKNSPRTVRNILVANRGEIALRILRTIRALGLESVLAHSEVDAAGPGFELADRRVCLGPAEASASYLSIEAILEAARHTGADAIHPGYGFLSEREAFARAVEEAGLTYIGPTPANVRALGDKVAARAALSEAGVPIVPGEREAVADLASLKQVAKRVGFPLLVKAAAGGGGKGMRIVEDEADLESSFRLARSEAENAFGDGTLFAEKYLLRARHVEVQVLGDGRGGLRLYPERDCSPQRRHQKLFEESPCPVLDEKGRTRLMELAHRALAGQDYRSAGTLEFLLDEEGEFHFLEMNTRLQVEHPVTEWITGHDLVAEQIAIAAGKTLPATTAEASRVEFGGWALEFRVNAEDPLRGFLPSIGTVEEARFAGGPGIRVDTACRAGTRVTPYYDSLIAKIIAGGPDRATALGRLEAALAETRITGVHTTLPVLRALLDDPEFRASGYHCQSLESRLASPEFLLPAPDGELEAILAVAGAIAHRQSRRGTASRRRIEENVPAGDLSPWARLGRSFQIGGPS